MSYDADPFSLEMSSFIIEGNVVDHTWSHFIRKENSKVDPVAKDMLAEIVWWYRPYVTKDLETGAIKIKKKYKSDLLQMTYAQLEQRLGYTKRQLEEGFKTLEKLGICERIFRTLIINNLKISNVLFISLNHLKLKQLREKTIQKMNKNEGEVSRNNVTPLTLKRVTNTENSQKNTPHVLSADAGAEKPPSVYQATKRNPKGEEKEWKLERIFAEAIRKNLDFTTSEIHQAWEILLAYEDPITDAFRFIEGTIAKLRKKPKNKEKTCYTPKKSYAPKSNIKFSESGLCKQLFRKLD